MKAYLYPTEAAAIAGEKLMVTEMVKIAAERGFTVVNGNSIIGRNLATGKDNPAAVVTRWSPPLATVDGQWCIPSCRSVFQTTYPRVEAAAGVTEVEVEPVIITLDDVGSVEAERPAPAIASAFSEGWEEVEPLPATGIVQDDLTYQDAADQPLGAP